MFLLSVTLVWNKGVEWDGQDIKVKLKEEQHALNELIVTGYGGQQKRATLTTAISKMDNKVLDAAAFSNVGSALQGSVTGLQVVNSSRSARYCAFYHLAWWCFYHRKCSCIDYR